MSKVIVDFEFPSGNFHLIDAMAADVEQNKADALEVLYAVCKRMKNYERNELLTLAAAKFEQPLRQLASYIKCDSNEMVLVMKTFYQLNHDCIAEHFGLNLDFWMAKFMNILKVIHNFGIYASIVYIYYYQIL